MAAIVAGGGDHVLVLVGVVEAVLAEAFAGHRSPPVGSRARRAMPGPAWASARSARLTSGR